MAKEKLPETLEELCDYIERHASRIFIREQDTEGKWDSFALNELPIDKCLHHTLRFIKEGRIPTRLLTEQEVSNG